ncbi:MAG: alcohol dehydrogenase catalytic domain-containing protein [Chloroflexi bacterium]|nr:alcohol dehydrogenase catalytic domain-containing protein [Chloroflexota bacterium]
MKAIMKVAAEKGAVELREVPEPAPGEGEVVLKVAAASICGSDLHFYNWDPVAQGFFTPPMVMGHEFAGTVVATGHGVSSAREGDRVTVESVVSCGVCTTCRRGDTHLCPNRRLFGIHRPGGMAEYVAAPVGLLHHVPEPLPVEHAAIVEPTVVAVHAVLRQPPRPGDVVLVTGPGPVGLLAGQAAKAAGAEVFVAGTPADEATRLPIARGLGLRTLDPSLPLGEALRQAVGGPHLASPGAAGEGQNVDLVIECSGSARALDSALQVVRPGGAITLLGLFGAPIQADLSAAIRKEVNLRASYIGTWHDFDRAIQLLADGAIQVAPLLQPYRLEDALNGFEDAMQQRVMKPLLTP